MERLYTVPSRVPEKVGTIYHNNVHLLSDVEYTCAHRTKNVLNFILEKLYIYIKQARVVLSVRISHLRRLKIPTVSVGFSKKNLFVYFVDATRRGTVCEAWSRLRTSARLRRPRFANRAQTVSGRKHHKLRFDDNAANVVRVLIAFSRSDGFRRRGHRRALVPSGHNHN